MTKLNLNTITVFEHEALYVHKGKNELSEDQLKTLQVFYKEDNFPYYSLVNNGVRFCEYVGVIQIGKLTIEVLPKADNKGEENWRKILLDMLGAVGMFNIHAPTSANLKLASNSVLDLYFELFINQAEELLHKGLIKKYRKTEGNQNALKGGLLFGKHIQQNLTHQEHFYTRHTVYDKEHPLNSVLYKTIYLLKEINVNSALQSRIYALLLNFPELPDINVSESFFSKLEYNRKSEPYRPAIEIARLLLLNYHPDVTKGQNHVLALMFDMNMLWEKFVYVSLKKYKPEGVVIKAQTHKYFWKREGGYSKKMIPDIVIEKNENQFVVLDTKWKNIGDLNPSDADLRQMFAYSKFHNNAHATLIYPGDKHDFISGNFHEENHTENHKGNILSTSIRCNILKLPVNSIIKKWQEDIANYVFANC